MKFTLDIAQSDLVREIGALPDKEFLNFLFGVAKSRHLDLGRHDAFTQSVADWWVNDHKIPNATEKSGTLRTVKGANHESE